METTILNKLNQLEKIAQNNAGKIIPIKNLRQLRNNRSFVYETTTDFNSVHVTVIAVVISAIQDVHVTVIVVATTERTNLIAVILPL